MPENDKAKDAAKPTATDVATAPAPEPPEDDSKPTLTVERLITDGQAALGFHSADVAGAFHGVDPAEEVTITDAKKRVRDWLRAPVSTDDQE